jgi:DNA-binding SARP family transcriptional activator
MEFRILGPLEVFEEGRRVELGGARQRALLAILLTRANHVVSRDHLIDALFGEEPREAAGNLLQVYVSRLRKALEPGRERRQQTGIVVTRAPGYLVRVEPDQLDLERFERLAEEGRRALAASAPEAARERLVDALELWRGPALADFAFEPFAQGEARRLEELRLATLEDRIEADLALGRHAGLVGELEVLVDAHPLRERPRGQLMLALYRSGRQAEALEAYQLTRRVLVDDLGIEPSAGLQELERAILRQDASLGLEPIVARSAPERSILLIPGDDEAIVSLIALAEPLAGAEPQRELVLARLVPTVAELGPAVSGLHRARDDLLARGVSTRAAGFTSDAPAEDAARLAVEQDVELVLVAGVGLVEALPGGFLGRVIEAAPSDVAVLATAARDDGDGPVLVPFGGVEHDWAALELAAWLAAARRLPMRLVGPLGDFSTGRRDSSRLLARASLLVQRFAGVAAEPVLGRSGPDTVVEASEDATLVVLGLSTRWKDEGLGATRTEVIARSERPIVIAARGIRPGGLAPSESLTRFSWSLRETAAG